MSNKIISLQAAKLRVSKAVHSYRYAKERGLPCNNYPMMAFNECRYRLAYGDEERFERWYDDKIQPEIERIRANYEIAEQS